MTYSCANSHVQEQKVDGVVGNEVKNEIGRLDNISEVQGGQQLHKVEASNGSPHEGHILGLCDGPP